MSTSESTVVPDPPEFSRTALLALTAAKDQARLDRAQQIGTGHLLLGLAAPVGSDSSRVLEMLGIAHAEVQEQYGRDRERSWWAGRASPLAVPFSFAANLIVTGAMQEAAARGDREISTGDLLLSLARYPRWPGGRFLARRGLTPDAVADALVQAGQPVDIATDPSSSPQPTTSLADADRTAATSVDVSVQCSRVVTASPDRTWELMSSPEAWSLGRRGGAMFEVPHADGLRFYVGPIPGWAQPASWCAVFEPASSPARREITLSARTLPTGLSVTASVHEALAADWAEIRVTGAAQARDGYQRAVATRLRADLDGWLKAIGRALAGEASWPSVGAPPHLVAAWAAEPTVEQPRSTSTVVLIAAEPDVVWNLIRRPWVPQVDAGFPVIHSDRIPGTPTGGPGAAWYNIRRSDDGSLMAEATAVTQYADGRALVRRAIGTGRRWPLRVSFRLAPDAGQTRLEVEYRWPAALTASRRENLTVITDRMHQQASGYKAAAEAAARAAGGLTPEA